MGEQLYEGELLDAMRMSGWYGFTCRDGVIGDGSHSLHRAGVE